MDAGLRGFTVGGAQVSEKHCGFVVNRRECDGGRCVGTDLRGKTPRKGNDRCGAGAGGEKLLGDFPQR